VWGRDTPVTWPTGQKVNCPVKNAYTTEPWKQGYGPWNTISFVCLGYFGGRPINVLWRGNYQREAYLLESINNQTLCCPYCQGTGVHLDVYANKTIHLLITDSSKHGSRTAWLRVYLVTEVTTLFLPLNTAFYRAPLPLGHYICTVAIYAVITVLLRTKCSHCREPL